MRFGIRLKMVWVVATALAVLAIALLAFARQILSSTFRAMEDNEVHLTVERLETANDQHKALLWERAFDWACWDDAYQFVQDGNKKFRDVNLGTVEVGANRIDLVSFVKPDGKVVASTAAKRFKDLAQPKVDEVLRQLGSTSPQNMDRLATKRSFFILHQGTPMVIAVRRITRTNLTGDHVGWLIWGQYMRAEDFRKIAHGLKIVATGKAVNKREQIFTTEPPNVVDNQTIDAFLSTNDLDGKPIWRQKLSISRDLFGQGIETFVALFRWLVFASLAFCTILFFAIDFIFLRRIQRLSQVLRMGAKQEDVVLPGNDELSDLAAQFRQALAALETNKMELERVNESLEETVELRTKDLTLAIDEAEKANGAKSAFLSHMSHELRTPLNAVIGFAQLIEMRNPDPETLSSVQAILKGGNHLLNLVNEILDLSKIEAGSLSLSSESIRVEPIIVQACDFVRPLANDRNIEIVIEGNPEEDSTVTVDAQRYLQVVLNILSNAVKYNQAGGKVTVRWRRFGEGKVRIEVQDTGFGIEEAKQERLFAPFERLGQNKVEGAGLGLALSRNLARTMGGDITLLKTSSEGTTFAIDLVRSGGVPERVKSISAGRQRMLYLVGEDGDPTLVARVLEDLGEFELHIVRSSFDAASAIEDQSFDIVLFDGNFSHSAALDLYQMVRTSSTPDSKVIFLCEQLLDSTTEGLMNAGATACLAKPIDLTAFVILMDRLIPREKKAA